MRDARVLLLGLAMASLLACTPPKPVAYLQEAENTARQGDVRQILGEPSVMKPLPDGGAEWIYRSWDHDAGSRITAPSTWCEEYRLVFDAGGVLRTWDRQTTQHLGETMPATCRKAMASNQ
jgi:hypothetical protein